MPNPIDVSVLDTGIKTEHLIILKEWGHYLANGTNQRNRMTSSQIRKFFGEIKRIQANFFKNQPDIILLDPKIAYAAGRARPTPNRPTTLDDFYRMISVLLSEIGDNKNRYSNFVRICEAIVAYHKVNGGK